MPDPAHRGAAHAAPCPEFLVRLAQHPDPLTFAEACQLLPSRPHVSTMWRWYRRGRRGVRLRTVVVGGRRFVTGAALADFVGALSDPEPGAVPPPSGRRRTEMTRAAQRAAAEL